MYRWWTEHWYNRNNIKRLEMCCRYRWCMCLVCFSTHRFIQLCQATGLKTLIKRVRHSCPGRYRRGRYVGWCPRTNRRRTFPARRSCRFLAAQARHHSAVHTCKALGIWNETKMSTINQSTAEILKGSVESEILQDGIGASVDHQTARFIILCWSCSVLMLGRRIRRAHFLLLKSKRRILITRAGSKSTFKFAHHGKVLRLLIA